MRVPAVSQVSSTMQARLLGSRARGGHQSVGIRERESGPSCNVAWAKLKSGCEDSRIPGWELSFQGLAGPVSVPGLG